MRAILAAVTTVLMLGGCAGPTIPGQPATSAAQASSPAVARPVAAAPYQGPVPAFMKTPEIEATYRWAAPNRAILQYFPCTCGCESESHTSNWNCYVQEEKPGGEYVWDPMSAG